jgi:hypothetical protein
MSSDDSAAAEAGALEAAIAGAAPGDLVEVVIRVGKLGHEELEGRLAPLLHHRDGEVRAAAIRVLGFYWQLAPYRATAEEMAARDPDAGARAAAIMALTAYGRDSRDRALLARFDGVLRDRSEDVEVRAAAYRGILRVAGVPASDWPEPTSAFDDIDRQVDWPLVERLLAG